MWYHHVLLGQTRCRTVADKGQGVHSDCRGSSGGVWTQKVMLWLWREYLVLTRNLGANTQALAVNPKRIPKHHASYTVLYFFATGCLLPATLDGTGMLEIGPDKRERWEEEKRISENSNHDYLVYFRGRMEFGIMYFKLFICKMRKSKHNKGERHRHR